MNEEEIRKVIAALWTHPNKFTGDKCKTCLPLDDVEEAFKSNIMRTETLAERLYEVNRQLSIKIALDEGLSPKEVTTLNGLLGMIIKDLRLEE